MNAERRKALEAVSAKLEDAKSELETLREEEEGYYDNMPESLQSGEKGEKAQAAMDAMQEAVDSIESAVDNLNTAAE